MPAALAAQSEPATPRHTLTLTGGSVATTRVDERASPQRFGGTGSRGDVRYEGRFGPWRVTGDGELRQTGLDPRGDARARSRESLTTGGVRFSLLRSLSTSGWARSLSVGLSVGTQSATVRHQYPNPTSLRYDFGVDAVLIAPTVEWRGAVGSGVIDLRATGAVAGLTRFPYSDSRAETLRSPWRLTPPARLQAGDVALRWAPSATARVTPMLGYRAAVFRLRDTQALREVSQTIEAGLVLRLGKRTP